MAPIRLAVAQGRVSLAALFPVPAAGLQVLAEVAECRRRIPLPDTTGAPVVRNARFGADARPGERIDGVCRPRQLEQRRERWVRFTHRRRTRANGHPQLPFSRTDRPCLAVTTGLVSVWPRWYDA